MNWSVLHAWRQDFWRRGQDGWQLGSQKPLSLPHHYAALQQEGADLIDDAGALADQALTDTVQRLQVELICGLRRQELHSRRLLLRQAFHLSGVERERGQRQWNEPVRTGVVATHHRDSVRQYHLGEGTRRARSSYAAGSSGEGAETRQHQHDRGGKRVSDQLRRQLQRSLCQAPSSRQRYPPFARSP